ncbi:MAG: hypothetical protein ACREX9_13765, partial [Gammaproteobacteria bacterium]
GRRRRLEAACGSTGASPLLRPWLEQIRQVDLLKPHLAKRETALQPPRTAVRPPYGEFHKAFAAH